MKLQPLIRLLALATLFVAPLQAGVKPNPLFSDGAVLQRDKPVPVWGTADDGEKITVEFENQKVSTTAAGGKWRVDLQPMEAGGPFAMTITGKSTVSLKNLLVGDVWLCSGQSNMHFRMKAVRNATKEIAAMDHPEVRFFTVGHRFGQEPLDQLDGAWQPVTSATAGECSAVAGYFGTALHQELGVPIGLIVSSVGGTRIEAWMRSETLAATGESKSLIEKWKDVPAEEFARIADVYSDFQHQRDHVHPAAVRKARAEGKPAPPAPVAPKQRCHDCPSALHNGMIEPLESFPIRGVIWYQGESNSGQPGPYQKLLPAMIADWRKVWGCELPFYFVQLASYNNTNPAFREAQMKIWQNTPHTAMAVTTDVGDAGNIHPIDKRPVGERLAIAARALTYSENIEFSGPVFNSVRFDGARAIVSFTHQGGGLVAKDGDLKGFTLAGSDGRFVPAMAVIEGNNVIVTAGKITAPAAVRYNWASVTEGNLFNRAGLPAPPFRSDAPDKPNRSEPRTKP